MGFTKFVAIVIISLIVVFGYAQYKEWKVDNLQKAYNYNLEGLTFWSAFFIHEHSAGQVYLWRNYPNFILFMSFFWSMLSIHLIAWKWDWWNMIGRTTFINDFVKNCEKIGLRVDEFDVCTPAMMANYLKKTKNIERILVIRRWKRRIMKTAIVKLIGK